ncbi:MAG: amylo-alpha-1,6-glucosidase [Candidatus Woesearchaeota archaeon]
MNVSYGSVEKEVEGFSFFLTDNSGGFFNYALESHIYSGLFAYFNDSFRILESITVEGFYPEHVSYFGNYAELAMGDFKQWLWMPFPSTIVCQLSSERCIRPFLDVKRAYDNRNWGRYCNFERMDDVILVEFTKRTDEKEDKSHGTEEFRVYVAIKGAQPVIRNEWAKRLYHNNVNEPPMERYVFLPVEFNAKKIAVAAAKTPSAAIKLAELALNTLPNGRNMPHKGERELAAFYAERALEQLLVGEKVLFAGLPWFFQDWSRDTAVSIKALSFRNPESAKNMLLAMVRSFLPDGRLQNKAGSKEGNADAAGWAFKRIGELSGLFSARENYIAAQLLEKSIQLMRKNYEKQSLICNNAKETWMDTTGGTNDSRSGFRIEIQALQLSMYALAYKLTKKPEYKRLEDSLKEKVRKVFWNGRILADGKDDWTARPNIFIAAYAYPELLSKEEWTACFENALKELWLPWGGLASISKNSPLFVDSYTGSNDRSYHRGDSWFWINNLAAIVMNRINRKKFEEYISKIVDASAEEILWHGALGSHAELSSAKQLESHGCLNQAWSDAMFLELIRELGR